MYVADIIYLHSNAVWIITNYLNLNMRNPYLQHSYFSLVWFLISGFIFYVWSHSCWLRTDLNIYNSLIINSLSSFLLIVQWGLECFAITVRFILPWWCLSGSAEENHTSDNDSSVLTRRNRQKISPSLFFPLRRHINTAQHSFHLTCTSVPWWHKSPPCLDNIRYDTHKNRFPTAFLIQPVSHVK